METLDRRALNRALLARQLLLQRERRAPADTIAHLVAMQAQEPPSPHIGLWTRLEGYDPAELDALHADRAVVRGWLMRCTLHVALAADYLAMRPFFADVGRRRFTGQFRRQMDGIDLDELCARARVLLEAEPLGLADIGRRLAERWPDRDHRQLGYAAGFLLPVVQLPPRGLWRDNRRPKVTTAEQWLGTELDATAQPDETVLRYLAAFGPSTAADVRAWSGLTGAAATLERLRPRLRAFRDERGRELLDVPDGPLPDPATPAPVRYLPVFDNVILAHADRSRILADGYPPRIADHPTVLVDGFAVGTWAIDDGRLTVTLFAPADGHEAALEEEGERLLAFAADAPPRGVRITAAGG